MITGRRYYKLVLVEEKLETANYKQKRGVVEEKELNSFTCEELTAILQAVRAEARSAGDLGEVEKVARLMELLIKFRQCEEFMHSEPGSGRVKNAEK